MTREETGRRLHNLIRYGLVEEVQYSPPRCRVRSGELLTDWLPWLTPRAGQMRIWSPPETGEEVLLLSLDGNTETAFVLPALFSHDNPAPTDNGRQIHITLPGGCTVIWDSGTRTLSVSGFDTLNAEGGHVNLRAETITLTGNITVEGNTTIRGSVTQTGGPLSSMGVVLHSHVHGGVKAGGDTTGGPQ